MAKRASKDQKRKDIADELAEVEQQLATALAAEALVGLECVMLERRRQKLRLDLSRLH